MINFQELNKQQTEAVTSPLGPVLVLAGPGSGKTKTLTSRIAFLIEKKMVKPENLLALTFTNKAAKEMRSRLEKLLSKNKTAAAGITMGTFHSVCARLLRKEISALGYDPSFVIFDTDDQLKQLREICEQQRLDKKFPPSLFSALISKAKNLLQTPAELDLGLSNPLAQKLQAVYTAYQDALYRQNALDFDDLLMLTVKIFQNSEKALKKYQKQFAYILVDEYQDTNQAQYIFLRLLGVHHNLFVVGDDAQSIYGFRGSNIANILNFEKDFPEALVIKLEQNYRSSQNILDIAQKVIELNSEQKQKTLWTQNPVGEKIILSAVPDERAEAEFVAKKIIQLSTNQKEELEYQPDAEEEEYNSHSILDRFLKARKMYGRGMKNFLSNLPQLPKAHGSLQEFCVLYRTHAQSRALEEVFIEAAIPYQIVGGLKFYERKEIKDLLAYLRLVLNFRDLVSLKRVINEPPRGIGEKSYGIIRDLILDASAKKDLDLKDFIEDFPKDQLQNKAQISAGEFFGLLEEFSSLPKGHTLPELMKLIVRKTGLEKYLKDGSEKGQARWENVEELFTVAAKFKNLSWREAVQQLLEEVALLSEIDSKDESKDAVTLMTLHSAKGLEFDNVFFVGLEEGILPHSRSLLEPSELAEEIRLAYVGLTRARKRLFLLYTHSRRVFGNLQLSQPSRILKVLPKDKLQLQGGAEEHFSEDIIEDSEGLVF